MLQENRTPLCSQWAHLSQKTREEQRALQVPEQTAADHGFWGPHWGSGLPDPLSTRRGRTTATEFWGSSRFPRESKSRENAGGRWTQYSQPGADTEINLEAVKTENVC